MFKQYLPGLGIGLAAVFATSAGAAVNLNTAGANQFTQLKGIGPVTAQAIVKDRKAHGDYESVDELKRVKGIGPKTIKDIRDNATTGDD